MTRDGMGTGETEGGRLEPGRNARQGGAIKGRQARGIGGETRDKGTQVELASARVGE